MSEPRILNAIHRIHNFTKTKWMDWTSQDTLLCAVVACWCLAGLCFMVFAVFLAKAVTQ